MPVESENDVDSKGFWESAKYQRVLLSWAEVKGRLVEHLNKVLQARHIHFILHRLPNTHKLGHMSHFAEIHTSQMT